MFAQPGSFSTFVDADNDDPLEALISASQGHHVNHHGSRIGQANDRQDSNLSLSAGGEFTQFGIPREASADAQLSTEVRQGFVNDGQLLLHSEAPFGAGGNGISQLMLTLRAGTAQQNSIKILDAAGASGFTRFIRLNTIVPGAPIVAGQQYGQFTMPVLTGSGKIWWWGSGYSSVAGNNGSIEIASSNATLTNYSNAFFFHNLASVHMTCLRVGNCNFSNAPLAGLNVQAILGGGGMQADFNDTVNVVILQGGSLS